MSVVEQRSEWNKKRGTDHPSHRAMLVRLAAYKAKRDAGMSAALTAQTLQLTTSSRFRYERWYRSLTPQGPDKRFRSGVRW